MLLWWLMLLLMIDVVFGDWCCYGCCQFMLLWWLMLLLTIYVAIGDWNWFGSVLFIDFVMVVVVGVARDFVMVMFCVVHWCCYDCGCCCFVMVVVVAITHPIHRIDNSIVPLRSLTRVDPLPFQLFLVQLFHAWFLYGLETCMNRRISASMQICTCFSSCSFQHANCHLGLSQSSTFLLWHAYLSKTVIWAVELKIK